MQVAIASDHAGYNYKTIIVKELTDQGFTVLDLGAPDAQPSDYPDHAANVAEALQQGRAERGILICGSAVGVNMAVNKFRGIRAGICHDTYSARQGVEHDDMNVLCFGERVVGIALAKDIVAAFLNAQFSHEERHLRRLEKIAAIEKANLR